MIGLVGASTGVVVKEATNLIVGLIKGIDFVEHTEVLVGIPEESSPRGDGISNAQLMYIHTNGSPINRIPARPVIEPALSEPETADRIKDYLKKGVATALTGNIDAATACYSKAGMIGSNAAQKRMTGGDLAPNAPITIHGGWMRNHVSGKPVYIKGKGSSNPLIDTGSLRKSITYVIRRK